MTWDKSDKTAVMFASVACGALALYLLVTPGMVMTGVVGILSIPGRVLGINDPNRTFYLPPPKSESEVLSEKGEYTLETMPRAPQAPSSARPSVSSPVSPSAPVPNSPVERPRDLFSTFSKIQQGTANGQP